MKPPFVYFGAKQQHAKRIVRLLPDHGHYVEPFAGSLAVLLEKPRSHHETVNDLDRYLVTFWRILRDRPDDLERAIRLTPHSRVELERALLDPDGPTEELEVARRVHVLLTQGRSGTPLRTGWRRYVDPGGTSSSMPRYLEGYANRVAPAAARLYGVSLECRPAVEVIEAYGRSPDVLLYEDPPYPVSTRSPGAKYAVEMLNDDQHRELAEANKTAKAKVLLSGYACPLYDVELYPDWNRIELDAWTGNGGDGNRDRTEVLWANFDLEAHPPTLFDHYEAHR